MSSTLLAVSLCGALALSTQRMAVAPRTAAAAAMRAPAVGMLLPPNVFRRGAAAERELLRQVGAADASRGKILNAFEALEAAAPAPADVLTTAEGARLIDGRWTLLSTVAARVGDEEVLDETGVSNAVNASGIVIDTDDGARKPVQEIDFARGRIGNELRIGLPAWLQSRTAVVRVSGSFEADARDGRRANVEFDSLDVFVEEAGEGAGRSAGARRVLSAGFLFDIVRALRPALINGRDGEGSWLETTCLNERVRLGRGNKGSIFILTRAEDDGPLGAWPL